MGSQRWRCCHWISAARSRKCTTQLSGQTRPSMGLAWTISYTMQVLPVQLIPLPCMCFHLSSIAIKQSWEGTLEVNIDPASSLDQ